jgi:GT2 family glycosyltransferase
MVNYNGSKFMGRDDLIDAIESFLKTDYKNFEFIFVDNNSSDDSINVAKDIFKKHPKSLTKVVNVNKNLGFAGGCEEGMKNADGDYIVLVNNDNKVITRNWLKELLKVLNSDKRIGIVSSKQLKWDKPNLIDSVGLSINPLGFVTIIGENEKDVGQYDKIKEVLVWQPPIAFRKGLIKKIGGFFDLDYAPVSLHDDTDSSIRTWMAGYKILYVPTSVALHKRSATMKKLPRDFVAFHSRKNILQTMLKNYELKNVVRYTSFTFLIYIFAIPYYLFVGRYDQVKATIKAITWNILYLPKTILKRWQIQKLRKVKDNQFFHLFEKINFSDVIKRRKKKWP